jgi:predicted amidophosphoribosyltransferase
MVHRLKYEGMTAMAAILAAPMADLLPGAAQVLVPVPRAPLRVWRYGIDPAVALAAALGTATGLPVVPALRGPPWWPHRAGRNTAPRRAPTFRHRRPVGPGAVLVDDVLTTGTTLQAAAAALGGRAIAGLTATAAGTLSLEDTDPRRAPGEAGWR